MKRIYLLEKDLEAAHSTLKLLRSHGLTEEQLHVIAGTRWKEALLPASESTLEEVTDVNHAQMRGVAAGAAVGALAGLTLAFLPVAGVAAASAALLGGGAGGSLGLVIGTLVGVKEPHPVVSEFTGSLNEGKILVAADLGQDSDAIIAELIQIGPEDRIHARSFGGIEEVTAGEANS